jgi:co-chaperonin GroES (HSP10)
MKALYHFVVKLEKTHHDTIEMENGTVLHVDPKWKEFERRVMYGEVTSTPVKYDVDVEVGDTLFFHHHVVMSDALKVEVNDEQRFIVGYDPVNTLSCHAIAYRSKKTGELHMLADWVFLQPIEEEKQHNDFIEIVDLKPKTHLKAKVFCCPKDMITQGVKPGDIVGFKQNRDYEMKLEDETVVFRMRSEDMMYVQPQDAIS